MVRKETSETLMILGVALGFCSGFAFGFVTFIVALNTPIN
jgi:hypothetical protein